MCKRVTLMVCELCLFLKCYFVTWGCVGSSSLLGLSLIVVIGGYSGWWCAGFLNAVILSLWSAGSKVLQLQWLRRWGQ